jgi:hypothetical protein
MAKQCPYVFSGRGNVRAHGGDFSANYSDLGRLSGAALAK